MNSKKEALLQAVLDKATGAPHVFGTSFAIDHAGETWLGQSGNLNSNTSFFVASVTKLFTLAIILNLRFKGRLELEQKIQNILSADMLLNLHTMNGCNYVPEISIRNLLAHTSGIPDYFQGKMSTGYCLESELKKGNDQSWTREEAIERSKEMRQKFAPGKRKMAHYSDTNFQLLSAIIEEITGSSFEHSCQEIIFNPLELTQTYLYTDETDLTPIPFYYKSNILRIFKEMSSFGPDGGIVSTSKELLIFLRSFFNGELFPRSYIEELQQWNSIFFPIKSGVGLQKFQLPILFDPFRTMPYFIGHSGLSGALAFYSPKENLSITGTVNQIYNPSTSFRIMLRLTKILLSNRA
ncbi:MAG: beta-lactamase family protein [Bacteroidetes bacterium]|jgi:CubicO group peptidase (beta-lactamase class C family)|nr:beta-lactamase family protein [Bacteroidota bacterium]